eukprot:44112-Chlamydomonas_euryale.AAC.2
MGGWVRWKGWVKSSLPLPLRAKSPCRRLARGPLATDMPIFTALTRPLGKAAARPTIALSTPALPF